MAIFSMNIAKVSKSNGSSAVNSSAYIHREKYRADETGLLYDWRSKAKEEAFVTSAVMLPKNAPSEWSDPEVLWNAVEKVEKASNSLLARRIIVALPEELSLEQSKSLLQRYCQKNFVDEGMCVDMAIHWKEGNPHAHILLTTRPIKENGEWGAKEKKVYKLDENGERIPIIDPNTGEQKLDSRNRKQWERETVEVFSVNHKNMAEAWRSSWAEECNRYLSRANQIDHRSYKRQGLDIEPQVHVGYSSIKAQINERIKKIRETIKSLAEELKSLKNEIMASELESIEPPEPDYIDTFPEDWDIGQIEEYITDRERNLQVAWEFNSFERNTWDRSNTPLEEKDFEKWADNFRREYAPTSENLAKKQKEKEERERERQEELKRLEKEKLKPPPIHELIKPSREKEISKPIKKQKSKDWDMEI